MASFQVGQKFSSFMEFEQYLSCYENENFVKFSKCTSRKIEAAVRSGKTHVALKPDLIYYEIKYTCVRGGTFHLKGTGKRKTSSCKIECPAHISLRAAADGKCLEVKSVDMTHNHEISKVLFDHLPHQRRLTESEKNKARELLSLQGNKKLIQQKLQEETGKIVTLRDLSNLAKDVKSSSNDLHEAVSLLREKYRADVEILRTEQNVLKALFFQTEEMKLTFETYPEFLAFDGTYKLLSLNMTTFVFLIEDGNCDSRIVGVALAVDECEETLEWITLQFKTKNAATSCTQVIMTDKDIVERNVFKKHFGNTQLMLCAFHTLRTLGREITTEKFNITLSQKNVCLEILQKMVTAKSKEVFDTSLEKFNNVAPDAIKLYYYKNWHMIKEEWCKVFQMGKANFLNCTNNRIECINSKLKSTISKQSSLLDFIDKLFSLLCCLENERLHAGITTLQKNRLIPQSDGPLYDYSRFLTPRSLNALEEQIKIFKSKNYSITSKDGEHTISTSQEGTVYVTPTSCSCNFNRAMLLPCRHILAFRHSICLPLYDENLVHKRWSKNFYNEYLHNISSTNHLVQQTSTNVTTIRNHNPKSVQEKRRMALNVTNEIADIVSLLNTEDFNNCIDLLKNIKSHLQNGTKFQITEQNSSGLCDMPSSHNMPSTSTSSIPSSSNSNHSELDLLNFPNQQATDLTSIQMPQIRKQKGRPRGHLSTVIGLPKKKICHSYPEGPIPFIGLSLTQKENILLKCFIQEERSLTARTNLIEENEVEVVPDNIPNKVVNTNADLNLIKQYFTKDAWLVVEGVVKVKKNNLRYLCSACGEELCKKPSISCDGCLDWGHIDCVGGKQTKKSKYIFCKKCSS